MSYIGNEPIVSATRTITEVTATAGQTVFTANGGYTVGYIDVFLNGAQLQTVDFTATNGNTITLTEAAQVGDVIRLVAWGTFLASTALTNTNPSYSGTLTGGTGVVNIGSGQLVKDASGNVGIGTSSPDNSFTVSRAGADVARFVNSSSNGGNWQLKIGGGGFEDRKLMFTDKFGGGDSVRMTLDSSGNLGFNSGYGSVATAYGCRAWVNFNGTGTVAIRASGNVSSITDNGTGNYTLNFTNTLVDTNYSIAGFIRSDLVTPNNVHCLTAGLNDTKTTSALQVLSRFTSGLVDSVEVDVQIFR